MDNGGFIKLSRKIEDWGWYNDINTFYLFFHCIIKANWKEGTFQGKKIPRGSFVTSLNKLSEETKLSIQSIRTAIKHLISTGEITSKSFSKYRIITINNYCKYQDNNKDTNIQLTSKQQATNKQLTTIEEIKKERSKEIYISSSSIGDVNLFDFIESNFGRTLSPVEYEEVMNWEDNELTRYAIKQAVISNKCGIKYIARIISAYKRENIKTVQQAQEREREYVDKQKNNTVKKYKTSSERIDEVAKRFLSEE